MPAGLNKQLCEVGMGAPVMHCPLALQVLGVMVPG